MQAKRRVSKYLLVRGVIGQSEHCSTSREGPCKWSAPRICLLFLQLHLLVPPWWAETLPGSGYNPVPHGLSPGTPKWLHSSRPCARCWRHQDKVLQDRSRPKKLTFHTGRQANTWPHKVKWRYFPGLPVCFLPPLAVFFRPKMLCSLLLPPILLILQTSVPLWPSPAWRKSTFSLFFPLMYLWLLMLMCPINTQGRPIPSPSGTAPGTGGILGIKGTNTTPCSWK